jgi:hypothetical protein
MNTLKNISSRVFFAIGDFFESTVKALNHMNGMDEDEGEQDELEQPQEMKKAIIPFEDKYLHKYKQLTSTTNAPSKTSFVIESTPIGNVVMKYDVEKESFLYYSDHIVPFRLLEVVAMKYVCMFDCKQVYVERHEEVVPNNAKQAPKTTKDIMNQMKNPTPSNNKKEQIEVKMNRYSNGGRFSNFNILQPVAKHITDKKQLLKFSDFKRQPLISEAK